MNCLKGAHSAVAYRMMLPASKMHSRGQVQCWYSTIPNTSICSSVRMLMRNVIVRVR
jgi:hypothetical protein